MGWDSLIIEIKYITTITATIAGNFNEKDYSKKQKRNKIQET